MIQPSSGTGFWKAIRLVLFVVVVFNALAVIVYLRTQEYQLQYRRSRLQAQLEREVEQRRQLNQQILDQSQKEKLDEREKSWEGRSE